MTSVITESYRKQNALLHEQSECYGSGSARHAPRVKELADALETRDILDYGAGKRQLEFGLGFAIKNYDPAIPGIDGKPDPADLVVCTDVLEHVEPECLDAVLADLRRVTRKQLFVEIAARPSTKTLPDGRNAHLSIHSPEWWEAKLARWFEPIKVEKVAGDCMLGIYNAQP